MPPIVHEGRRWHQRTHFTHSPSPVTRQPASSIMHFGRACKFHSSFGLGRPQPPLQQLPSRTLLSLRCCQSHVLTGPSQGKIHGSCTPCMHTAAFHARKCCCLRNPCNCSSPFHARKCRCPRNPCNCSSPFHARKCCRPRNPCTGSSPFHARKCCCPRNPCIYSSPFHARKCRCPRNPCICSSPFHARKCCCPRNPCNSSSPFHARKCRCPRNPCTGSSAFHARNASSSPLHLPCPAQPPPSPHLPPGPTLQPATSCRMGRHRRVSFARADSARGRLGGGQAAWRRMQRGASACRNRA